MIDDTVAESGVNTKRASCFSKEWYYKSCFWLDEIEIANVLRGIVRLLVFCDAGI